MKRYTSQDVDIAISKVGIEKGDHIFIHSDLLKLGMPSDIKISELTEYFFHSILEIVGQSGSISVPSFNFDFCKGELFDLQKTPSKKMGSFAEYVRKRPDSLRSKHPMQSISIVGKQGQIIAKNDTLSAFDKGGTFDNLLTLNAKIILLGAHINYVSAVHYVEQKSQVPYRYWKSFTAPYVDQHGSLSNKTYKMFVKVQHPTPKIEQEKIYQSLKNNNQINEVALGSGTLASFKMKDFVNITTNLLSKDPYILLTNKQEIIAHHKQLNF